MSEHLVSWIHSEWGYINCCQKIKDRLGPIKAGLVCLLSLADAVHPEGTPWILLGLDPGTFLCSKLQCFGLSGRCVHHWNCVHMIHIHPLLMFCPMCSLSLFFLNHLRVNCRHRALWGILKNFKGLSKNQFILRSCQTEMVRNALLIGAGERLTQRKGGRKARKLIDCSFSICLIWKSFIGCLWWLSLDFEVSTLRPVHT